MLRLRSASLAAALAAGVYCLSFAAPVPKAPQDPYAPASEGLVLEPSSEASYREGISMEELIAEFSRITGEHVLYTKDTEQLLAATRVDVKRRMEIPADAVWGTVETILRLNHFVLSDLRREEPRLLAVSSLDTVARSFVRSQARHVPLAEVESCRQHPAFLVEVVVPLPHLDVRALGNSMRQYIVDPNTLVFIPIPEASSLVVVGFGDEVAALVETLTDLDASAAALPAEPPPPVK